MKIVWNSHSPDWFDQYIYENYRDGLDMWFRVRDTVDMTGEHLSSIAAEYFRTQGFTCSVNELGAVEFDLPETAELTEIILRYSE
jgi:hypothetical protein